MKDCNFQCQAISSQANLRFLQVKPQSGGRRQNGQPVEFGQPMFVIG